MDTPLDSAQNAESKSALKTQTTVLVIEKITKICKLRQQTQLLSGSAGTTPNTSQCRDVTLTE